MKNMKLENRVKECEAKVQHRGIIMEEGNGQDTEGKAIVQGQDVGISTVMYLPMFAIMFAVIVFF